MHHGPALERSDITVAWWDRRTSVHQNGCIIWKGSTNRKYGIISVDGKGLKAHRLAWEFYNGCIPDGMCVCHRCDNPPCVNPDHMFLGSHLENVADRCRKNRTPFGELHAGTKISDFVVREIRALASSNLPFVQIAKRLGLSPVTCSGIARFKSRKRLTVSQ